jgi:hypothetical protein
MYYNGRKRYLRSSRKRFTTLVIVLTKSGRPLPSLPPHAGEGIRGSAGSSSKRRFQDHNETFTSTKAKVGCVPVPSLARPRGGGLGWGRLSIASQQAHHKPLVSSYKSS